VPTRREACYRELVSDGFRPLTDGGDHVRIWVNGGVLDDPEQPALSALDHGVTVGDGVFETVKIVDNRPFALTRHLARLSTSATGLGLPAPDDALVRRAIHDVIGGQHLPLGRLRLTWTGGPAPLGSGRGGGPCTLTVMADAMSAPDSTTAVATVPWVRNDRSAVTGLKTISYAENVVALAYARERGATEAVFANTRGELCEGTGSNIFVVTDGELLTPPLESGCLAGISRALVLEWCDAREASLSMDVLASAREIFLASTTRDIQPVHRCDLRDLDAPGPITKSAIADWRLNEAADIDP
jgi:branched-chain amino acid aminotransferase